MVVSTAQAPHPTEDPGPDPQRLLALVRELNILRKQVTAYPQGHPLPAASAAKALERLSACLETEPSLTLGIARESLVVGGTVLPRDNPVFREWASALFSRGIAALTLRSDLGADGLQGFLRFLQSAPDTATIEASEFEHLEIRTVDYRGLLATEVDKISSSPQEKTGNFWEGFVHGMLEGVLDPDGEFIATTADLEPEVIAQLANGHNKGARNSDPGTAYASAIHNLIDQIDREDLEERFDLQTLDKLGLFVSKLNPKIRRQFLSGVFGALDQREGTARKILERFPDQVILEILEDINQRPDYAPPLVVNLLQQLGSNPAADWDAEPRKDLPDLPQGDIETRLRTVFQQDATATTEQKEYRSTLRNLLAMDQAPATLRDELEQLRTTLIGQNIDYHLTAVIAEIASKPRSDEHRQRLQQSFAEILAQLLNTFDCTALLKTHERLFQRQDFGLLAAFATPQVAAQVVEGLQGADKTQARKIQALIRKIGASCAPPLLERLAEEPNMSKRRYLLERLFELGDGVIKPALARLRDSRWYLVRNLILLLRRLNNPQVVPSIRRLLGHPHPRVRQEALGACFHFKDPAADRYLLQHLGSEDENLRLQTIPLAGQSSSPAVMNRLLELLRQSGTSETDFCLKRAIIKALAEIGDSCALPELENLLRAKSLLRQTQVQRLKTEVIGSLIHYPAAEALALLDRLNLSGRGELAVLAAKVRASIA